MCLKYSQVIKWYASKIEMLIFQFVYAYDMYTYDMYI